VVAIIACYFLEFIRFVVVRTGAWTPCRRWLSSSSTSSPDDSTTAEQDEREAQQFQDEETMYEDDIKGKILDAALEHVQQHGWTKESLAIGAESLGYTSISHGLFPKGGVELVHHFYRQCNIRLVAQLEHDPHRDGAKQHEFLRDAVEKRLRMNEDYVVTGRWIEALGLMALPPNAPASLHHFAHLMDDMWHHAGDTSADFSWYSKRAALAGVYKSTELSMIQDQSPDFEETWQFLDRRIQDMQRLHDCSKQMRESTVALEGLFRTAFNMVGATGFKRPAN